MLGLPSDGVVCRSVLNVRWETSANLKVRLLILNRALQLRLSSTCPASTLQLLVLRLRVVDRGVLTKDEVGASELVHVGLALEVSVELAAQLVSLTNLLLEPDVCHFLFSNRYYN